MIKKYSEYIKEEYDSKFYKKDVSNKTHPFQIGDYVICKGEQSQITFKGEIGKIIDIEPRSALVKFPNRFHNGLHSGQKDFSGCIYDPTNCSYYIRFDLLTLVDSEFERKRKDELEKLRLKYQDVDPYGEEEWEMNEGAKLDKVIKIVRLDELYDKYKLHINKHKLIEDELSKYIGSYVLLKIWFSDPQELYNVRDSEYLMLNSVYSKDSGYYSDCPTVFIDLGDKHGVLHSGFPVNDNLVLYVREPMRVTSPEDPYGEEDWDLD